MKNKKDQNSFSRKISQQRVQRLNAPSKQAVSRRFQNSFLKKILFVFCWILSLHSSPVVALFVSVHVDKKTVALNETFTFSIRVRYYTKDPGTIQIPELSHLNDFYVLNQWSGTQRSMNYVNGKAHWENVYSRNYQLQPVTEGRLRLESLLIKVANKTFNTKVIFIDVTKKVKKQPSPTLPQSPFSFPHSQLFDQFFKNNLSPGASLPSHKVFNFKLNINKESVYVGEMIKADWILWMSLGNAQYREHQVPSLKGFWKEPLIERGGHQFLGTAIKKDILYRKILIDSQALFPVQEGVLEIDSYQIKVFRPTRGLQWAEEIKQTASQRIPVKPLPTEGRGNFSGAVGDFQVEAVLNQAQTQMNQPVTFRIKFKGQGHPRSIRMPSLPFPKHLKAYPPTEKSNFSIKNHSYKEFEVLLVPQKTGTFTLPSFSVTTFDPSAHRYKTHQIPSFTLQVLKGEQAKSNKLSFFDSDSVQNPVQNTPLLSRLKKKWLPYFNQKNFLKFWMTLYSLLILIVSIFYFYPSRSRSRKQLRRKVRLKLKKIERTLSRKEGQTYAVHLTNLIYFVLAELGQTPPSQELDSLLESLPPSLYQKFAPDLRDLVQELEALSFAPSSEETTKFKKHPLPFKKVQNLLQLMLKD